MVYVLTYAFIGAVFAHIFSESTASRHIPIGGTPQFLIAWTFWPFVMIWALWKISQPTKG